jgi:cytochrome P450
MASLFTHTDEAAHAAERRLVANAYSLTALLELERFVDQTTERLFASLETFADTGKPAEMDFWLHAYAFDVVGELAFGQAFGFVSSGKDVGDMMARSMEWLKKRFTVAMVPWIFPLFMSPLFGKIWSFGREEQENEKNRNQVRNS